jgi:hypothetical protein
MRECGTAIDAFLSPTMTSDSQIDEAIMAVLADRAGRWVKVAWVVVSAPDALGPDFPAGTAGYEFVANRVAALVDEDHLIAKGDITEWRHSEVKPA